MAVTIVERRLCTEILKNGNYCVECLQGQNELVEM